MRNDWIYPTVILLGFIAIGFGIFQILISGSTINGGLKLFGGVLILFLVCFIDVVSNGRLTQERQNIGSVKHE